MPIGLLEWFIHQRGQHGSNSERYFHCDWFAETALSKTPGPSLSETNWFIVAGHFQVADAVDRPLGSRAIDCDCSLPIVGCRGAGAGHLLLAQPGGDLEAQVQ